MNDNNRMLLRYVAEGDIRKAQMQAKVILNSITAAKDEQFKANCLAKLNNDYVQFKCTRSARIVERYLNGAAYSNRVEKWIRSLIEAASIDAIDTSDYAEV